MYGVEEGVVGFSGGGVMCGKEGGERRKDELEEDLEGCCGWVVCVVGEVVDIIVGYM